MTRDVAEDFAALKAFLNHYSFTSLLAEKSYEDVLRVVHKHHLALQTAVAELTDLDGQVGQIFLAAYGATGRQYLLEVASDCSEHVLALASGMFRSAGMTLRSSIESFAKAMSVGEYPEVLAQTSVPKVFEIAGASSFFSAQTPAHAFAGLKTVYGNLNLFAHTVGDLRIFGAHSAGRFPYISDATKEMAAHFAMVVRDFIVALVGGRRDLFDRFDHRNKAIVIASLTKPQRRIVLG